LPRNNISARNIQIINIDFISVGYASIWGYLFLSLPSSTTGIDFALFYPKAELHFDRSNVETIHI
jgi:hypothetical protein